MPKCPGNRPEPGAQAALRQHNCGPHVLAPFTSAIVRRCPTPTSSRPPTRPTLPRRSATRSDTRAASGLHNADELMPAIVARRLVGHLERVGFVVRRTSAQTKRARERRARG